MIPIVEQFREEPAALGDGLWRGSNWLAVSRFTCAVLLSLLILFSVVGGGAHLTVLGLGGTVLFLSLVAGLWEVRARRMGVRISEEALVVRRVFGTETLRWSDIDGFFSRRIGLWGDQQIHVRRKRVLGVRVPGRVGRVLPTVLLLAQNNVIGRWFGACDLVSGLQRVAQDQVIDALNHRLAVAQDRREPTTVET